MPRRPGLPTRRFGPGTGFGGVFNQKSNTPPMLPIFLIVMGALFVIGYFFHGSGSGAVSRVEGDFTCTAEVHRALPLLKMAYGDSMHKVLHVGPESCSVVSELSKEEETEVWGIEPYDIEDADGHCKSLVRKGFVRVADIKFALPYRAKSFALVIVSDAVEYLSPKYLNRTLPEMARISSDGVVVFTGFPGQSKTKATEPSKFGRPAKKRSSSWWLHFFVQTSLEENEAAMKKFKQAATEASYNPGCQIFHLKSYH
ncbi:hypothetical protein Leryth_024230 [Lithospermum erythrorhizon]|nr:hypothetical protein Leryth_024230 [Lithospermum erythrorhizon]